MGPYAVQLFTHAHDGTPVLTYVWCTECWPLLEEVLDKLRDVTGATTEFQNACIKYTK